MKNNFIINNTRISAKELLKSLKIILIYENFMVKINVEYVSANIKSLSPI